MNKIKKISSFLIVCIGVILFVGCSSSKASNDADSSKDLGTKENGVLTVGFCATWPPFESRDDNGELIGFDVDMAKAIGKDLGVEVKFEDANWQGLVPSVQKGDYDVLISCISDNVARKETVSFTDVYYELPTCVIVKKDNNQINSKEDLKDKVVGVQLGTADEKVANKLNDELSFKKLRTFNLPPDEMLDLNQGKLDAVVVAYPYAVSQIKETDAYKVILNDLEPTNIVMICNKDNSKLVENLNKSLKKIKDDGTYDKLIKKWIAID